MHMGESELIFIIVAFCLAAVLIMKRDSIPAPLRRWMALITLVLIVFAFVLVVRSFFQMG